MTDESGEDFARMGNINMHVEKPEKPEYYRTDFMCDCGPRQFEDSGYEAKYSKSQGKTIKGRKKFKRDENQQRCLDVLAEVKRRLGADDTNLLSRIIVSLNWDYEAHITSIENDMWSGIAAETYSVSYPKKEHELTGVVDGSYHCTTCGWNGWPEERNDGECPNQEPDTRRKLKVYVQCDSLETGMARVWKFFADELGLTDEGELIYSDADATKPEEGGA